MMKYSSIVSIMLGLTILIGGLGWAADWLISWTQLPDDHVCRGHQACDPVQPLFIVMTIALFGIGPLCIGMAGLADRGPLAIHGSMTGKWEVAK